MAKLNVRKESPKIYTHEGARAQRISPELELRRSVMACMLWEDEFYESGTTIADRIKAAISLVDPATVAAIAVEARTKMKLRHVPLLIVREMARIDSHRPFVAHTLAEVVQRADELSEFLAIYWADGKQPLSAQVKRGLSAAFSRFNEYELAKYNRDAAIKLRDVLFLCHAHPEPGVKGYNREARKKGDFIPKDAGSLLFAKLVANELDTPDTWEVNLSTGRDKAATFTRLIVENKLGGLAILRNLRNMVQSGVDEAVIAMALDNMKTDRILPFRFVSAARAVPSWESRIESVMLRCLSQHAKLAGTTVLIVDVSGSMYNASLSGKSEITRVDTACALAVLIREVSDIARIFATAGDDGKRTHATKEVPSRHGFALRDAIYNLRDPLGGGGIFLKQVIEHVQKIVPSCERVIVITDEQDCDVKGSPLSVQPYGDRNYLINVASAQNGIGYGPWTHFDGFSESIVEYILEYEKLPG